MRQNLNIARMPLPVFVKLGMHIKPHEAISRHTSEIPTIGNTNTAASQIVEVISLIFDLDHSGPSH
jgi:hypothetical protein